MLANHLQQLRRWFRAISTFHRSEWRSTRLSRQAFLQSGRAWKDQILWACPRWKNQNRCCRRPTTNSGWRSATPDTRGLRM